MNNQKGQSLFEVVVAIGLIAVALVAVVALLVQGQQNTTSSRDRSSGARAVLEANEWMRAQKESDWEAFRTRASAGGSTFCINDLSWVQGSCSSNITNQAFARQVTLTTNSANPTCEVKATVTVRWIGGSKPDDVTNYVFTNWRGGC